MVINLLILKFIPLPSFFDFTERFLMPLYVIEFPRFDYRFQAFTNVFAALYVSRVKLAELFSIELFIKRIVFEK